MFLDESVHFAKFKLLKNSREWTRPLLQAPFQNHIDLTAKLAICLKWPKLYSLAKIAQMKDIAACLTGLHHPLGKGAKIEISDQITLWTLELKPAPGYEKDRIHHHLQKLVQAANTDGRQKGSIYHLAQDWSAACAAYGHWSWSVCCPESLIRF